MSSLMTVVVLCPNARRQTVKVTPNSSILEILEEACKKQGIDPMDYDVRHYNRRLDLSLSVRFANLPNNALVELRPAERVRNESLITVALQLESGDRIVADFLPSSSLLDIVQRYIDSSGHSQSEIAQADEPVCVYMRQQFTGDQLRTTTLRSLGLTGGKTIIRLMYRPLDIIAEQAHVSAPLTRPPPSNDRAQQSCTTRKSMAPESNNYDSKQPRLEYQFGAGRVLSSPGNISDNIQRTEDLDSGMRNSGFAAQSSGNGKSTAAMENDRDLEDMDCDVANPLEEIGEIKFLGPRNAIVFNLEDISVIRKDDFPSDFFDLTLHDVQYLYADYKRVREELENEPLMLKSRKEARWLQQLACYKQTVIRIYFPDKLVLQGTFISEDTVQAVKEFVRPYLQEQQQDFYLYITPPKAKLSPDRTLLEARLVPAAVVYFGSDKPRDEYLHKNYRGQVSDPRAAWKVAAQHRQKCESDIVLSKCLEYVNANIVDNCSEHVVPPPQHEQTVTRPAPVSTENQGVRPKWLKLGNK